MKKRFEDLDAYERWARRRARSWAVAWIALGGLFIAMNTPSGGHHTKDLIALVASVVIGLALAKVFEPALMPGVARWGEAAWRQRLSWLVAEVLAVVVIWLLATWSGSELTIWPLLWAALIGTYVLGLFRAKEYGRWERERYEADLRAVANLVPDPNSASEGR